jgi:hypothetical protein
VNALRLYALPTLCLLSGCADVPYSYPPPAQRKLLDEAELRVIGHFVDMTDPMAEAYIVGDVNEGLEGGSGRSTRKRPQLRFFLDSIERLDFKLDFSVEEATFLETGPVAITVFINGNLLDKIECPDAGEKHFQKPVPAKFLRSKSVNYATLEIDKVWWRQTSGEIRGFILTRAGFIR